MIIIENVDTVENKRKIKKSLYLSNLKTIAKILVFPPRPSFIPVCEFYLRLEGDWENQGII